MIKAKLSNGDLILGLSEMNLQRLREGKPIVFDARPMGYDGNIGIIYGKTEQTMLDDINNAIDQRSILQ